MSEQPVPAAPASASIEPSAVAERFARLSGILAAMLPTVEAQSRQRCPYRDRLDRCTATFGCRNQRKPSAAGDLRRCGGDERLDYRSAWETG